ncbi:MAG TPA: hypothetical protein VF789_29780 [Thermoanaerobaculia bacterium]
MILACGTCTHWLLWTAFPAATPWAITFTIWFLGLSLAATVSRAELTAVPRLPVATALVLGSLILGVAILGPLAGLWFAPSCLLGSLAAVRLGSQRAGVRRVVLSIAVAAVAVLGALWIWSSAAYRSLGGAERVLLLEGTPAWPIELRRVSRGDCATLKAVAEKANHERLAATAEKRLADECASSSYGGTQ